MRAVFQQQKNGFKYGIIEQQMNIVIACEESGVVRDAFTEKGHYAVSCDLQSSRTPGNHYRGSIFDIINEGWDMMIGFPPCTYMSKAGARWMYQPAGVVNNERFKKAMDAKDFFMELWNSGIPQISLENPQPLKIVGLPTHTQVIQPYQFGHPFSKKTLLWLKGLPPLLPTKIISEYAPYLPSNTGGKKRGQAYMYKSISQKESSKTFQGIADAMANQWGCKIKTMPALIEPQLQLFA